MNAEIKAAMTLEGFKEALRDPVALTQGQKSKDSLRYILESEYSVDERKKRAVDEMQYYSGSLYATRMGPVLFTDDGAALNGVSLTWEELEQCVEECIQDGTYMTPAEEKGYQEYTNDLRKEGKEAAEKALASNSRELKGEAIRDYGAVAWDALLDDPDEFVRCAIAIYGSESYQLKLVKDPSPNVRDILARNGTPTVLAALLNAGEMEKEILQIIVERGDISIQAVVVEKLLDDPEALAYAANGNLCPELEHILLESPNPHIAMLGIAEANIEQCEKLAQMGDELSFNEKWQLENRMFDLKEPDSRAAEKEPPRADREDTPLPDDSFAPPDVPVPSR